MISDKAFFVVFLNAKVKFLNENKLKIVIKVSK